MSVISVAFSLENSDVQQFSPLHLESAVKHYKFDRVGNYHAGRIDVNVHHTAITEEAKREDIPFVSNEGIVIIVDGIIDNRTELSEKLDDVDASLTDVEYIYYGYMEWGNNVCKHLVGDYSIIIYDGRDDSLVAFRDPMGKRPLYLLHDKDIIVLSSLISIITKYRACHLNENWCVGYLSIDGVRQNMDSTSTPIEEISLMPPGEMIIVKEGVVTQKQFWSADDVLPVKYKNKLEAYATFKDIFEEAVRCRLRATGPIGIMLSGGLDSTAVASVAAKVDNNCEIKGYTSIPIDAPRVIHGFLVPDESTYVQYFLQEVDSISHRFVPCPLRHPLYDVKRLVEVFEQPYKTTNNAYWVDAIHAQASSDGCKVMLTGQYGNSTISYGEWSDLSNFFLNKRAYIQWIYALNQHGKFSGASRKVLLNKSIRNYIYSKQEVGGADCNQIVNDSLKKKHFISEKIMEQKLENQWYAYSDYVQKAQHPTLLNQIGVMESKMAAQYGMVDRDPTMDVRVVEFFLGIPDEWFIFKGKDRAFVREALKDYVPKGILNNVRFKGIQGYDWLERLMKYQPDIFRELKHLLDVSEMKYYYDTDRINEIINNLNTDGLTEGDKPLVKKMIGMIVFNKYIESIEKEVEV